MTSLSDRCALSLLLFPTLILPPLLLPPLLLPTLILPSPPPHTHPPHTHPPLALMQVWGVDLQKNEMIVKDVILVAQGEMALEEFLKQVNTTLH